MRVIGDTQEISQQVRELLEPEQVDHSNVPVWVRERVKLAMKRGDLKPNVRAKINALEAFEHATKSLGDEWADHCGRIKIEGIQYLVSEPYAERINSTMIAQLESFCKTLGLGYVFSANAEWFPGRTIRIIIGEKKPRPH